MMREPRVVRIVAFAILVGAVQLGAQTPDPVTQAVTRTGVSEDTGPWAYNVRQILGPNLFSTDGHRIRVQFEARHDQPMTIIGAAIGKQASGTTPYDFDQNAYVPLTFGGRASAVVAPGTTLWSDWVDFAYSRGSTYVLSTGYSNGARFSWGLSGQAYLKLNAQNQATLPSVSGYFSQTGVAFAYSSVELMSDGLLPYTYYVDAVNGSDWNSGTSPGRAWRSLDRLGEVVLKPGESVGLARGSTWRTTLSINSSGLPNNPIRFGAYGSGPTPTISASDLVTEWQPCGVSCWYSPVQMEPMTVYFDGRRGTSKASQASLSADGDWYWQGSLLYVFSKGNPAFAYSQPGIESGSRARALVTNNSSFLQITGLRVVDANDPNDGVVRIGDNSTNVLIEDCAIEGGAGSGVVVSGSLQQDNSVMASSINNNGAYGLVVWHAGGGNLHVQDSTIQNNGWMPLISSGINGPLPGALISGNRIQGNGNGPQGLCHGIYVDPGDSQVTHILGNVISNQSHGAGILAKSSAEIIGNTIYDNGDVGISVGQNTLPSTWTIQQNSIFSNVGGILEHGAQSSTSIMISQNVLYTDGVAGSAEINLLDPTLSTVIESNIITPTEAGIHYSLGLLPIGYVIDKNLLGGRPLSAFANGISYSYQAWTKLGFDLHTTFADPLLEATGPGYFAVEGSSPSTPYVGLISVSSGTF